MTLRASVIEKLVSDLLPPVESQNRLAHVSDWLSRSPIMADSVVMIEADKIGFILWEVTMLLVVISAGIGVLVLRRKASGRPAFSHRDRQLFFGQSQAKKAPHKLLAKFTMAVLLCLSTALLEFLILAPLGAGMLTVVLLLTSLGIVNKTLF
jgi:hypothetical protein